MLLTLLLEHICVDLLISLYSIKSGHSEVDADNLGMVDGFRIEAINLLGLVLHYSLEMVPQGCLELSNRVIGISRGERFDHNGKVFNCEGVLLFAVYFLKVGKAVEA